MNVIACGEPPVVSSAYVCDPVTMNVPLASCEIVPADDRRVAPVDRGREIRSSGAIKFGSVNAPIGAVNAWPSISCQRGRRDRSDHRRRVGDREGGDRGGGRAADVLDEHADRVSSRRERVRAGHGKHAGNRPRDDAIDRDAVAPVDGGGVSRRADAAGSASVNVATVPLKVGTPATICPCRKHRGSAESR